MATQGAPEKLAFVHIMKTAGSYVDRYLRERVLRRHRLRPWRNYAIANSWDAGLDRDWSDPELRGFLTSRQRRLYVHNHVNNWSRELIADYRRAGFFTFAWVRHPGDAMCSFYRWRIKMDGEPAESLDQFIGHHIDVGRPWEIPERWEDLDFVAPFSTEAFRDFLRRRFAVDLQDTEPSNASGNRGYDHYRDVGEISEEVHGRLQGSRQMAWFEQIAARASDR